MTTPIQIHHPTISIHAPLTGCDPHQTPKHPKNEQFQSTHPSRGATRLTKDKVVFWLISIHAPLTGCDLRLWVPPDLMDISIHAPLTGCDGKYCQNIRPKLNFNPRTPHGVRPICRKLQTNYR